MIRFNCNSYVMSRFPSPKSSGSSWNLIKPGIKLNWLRKNRKTLSISHRRVNLIKHTFFRFSALGFALPNHIIPGWFFFVVFDCPNSQPESVWVSHGGGQFLINNTDGSQRVRGTRLRVLLIWVWFFTKTYVNGAIDFFGLFEVEREVPGFMRVVLCTNF